MLELDMTHLVYALSADIMLRIALFGVESAWRYYRGRGV
jgi:hypothetical protein